MPAQGTGVLLSGSCTTGLATVPVFLISGLKGILPDMDPIAILEQAGETLANDAEFREIDVDEHHLSAALLHAKQGARVTASWEGDRFWIAYSTPDRWESESIERELIHQGESLAELLRDELADLGVNLPEGALAEEHFRGDDRMYVFRIALPVGLPAAAPREQPGGLPDTYAAWERTDAARPTPGDLLALVLRSLQAVIDEVAGA